MERWRFPVSPKEPVAVVLVVRERAALARAGPVERALVVQVWAAPVGLAPRLEPGRRAQAPLALLPPVDRRPAEPRRLSQARLPLQVRPNPERRNPAIRPRPHPTSHPFNRRRL